MKATLRYTTDNPSLVRKSSFQDHRRTIPQPSALRRMALLQAPQSPACYSLTHQTVLAIPAKPILGALSDQLVLHALRRLGVQFAHRIPSNLAWDNSSFWPRGLRPGLQSPFSRRPQPFSAHTPVWLSFLNLRQNPFVIGLIAGGDKAPLNLHQNLLVIAGGHNNFGLLSSFLLRSSPSIISITDWVIGSHKN